jgi:uncharacterized protein (DUF2252 family)
MRIVRTAKLYEVWLAEQIDLVPADIALKHQRMAASVLPFLWATYYRWAQVWTWVCADLQSAPVALAVGDPHSGNFGTWRDVQGRLVWGINDFDEVTPLPYTNDLVRQATSAALAIHEGRLALSSSAARTALLRVTWTGSRQAASPSCWRPSMAGCVRPKGLLEQAERPPDHERAAAGAHDRCAGAAAAAATSSVSRGPPRGGPG